MTLTMVHDSLLKTKLFAPPLRDVVVRDELMRRLETGTRGPLTIVIAPAGYGKTTLLGAWRSTRSEGRESVAWLALDASDNDVARFVRYLVAALRSVAPSVGAAVLSLLLSPPLPPVESLLTSLINDLDAVGNDLILVLDDYHVIEAAAVHEVVGFLLQHMPANVHLVVASRAELPLPLARLRSRGLLTELLATDLRFSRAEAADFLARIMGVRLSSDEITQLETRTEGWIAGIQLAALSLRAIQSSGGEPHVASGDAAKFIAAFTGSHRYIADYLVEEVLSREPTAIQQFLLHTSILDRMCANLCEAVALDRNSRAVLDHLEHANLFLIPLDAERRWYRYHHLFADLLRRRVGHMEPDLVAHLHRRASDWYERHLFIADAVHHALQAHDVERAADLSEAHATDIGLRRGEIGTILTWIDALPASLRRTRPLLGAQHAAILLLLGECDTARPVIEDAEAALAAGIPALAHVDRDALYLTADEQIPHQLRPVVGQLAALQAILALYRGDLSRVDALSQRAVDLTPETDPIWHARAQLNSVWKHRLTGDAGAATEQRMTAVVTAVRRSGQTYYPELATINLAHLYVLQGWMHRARATYELALHALERGVTHTIVEMYGHLGLGEIHYEWNELDLAEHHLGQGVRMLRERQGAHAEWSTAGYLALARVYAARGEHDRARATLEALIELARRREFVPELIEQAVALRTQLTLMQGDLGAAGHWAREVERPSDDDPWPFRREQVLLTWARVQIAQLSRQNAQRGDSTWRPAHPVGAMPVGAMPVGAMLEHLQRDAEAQGRMHRVVEVLILRSLATHATGDLEDALTPLRRAFVLAEPEGYVRVFADEGAALASLLRELQARGVGSGAYLATVLAACAAPTPAGPTPAGPTPAGPQRADPSTVDPLSDRELEILALLAAGLATEEIAGKLVITAGTVKNHLKRIFAKLGVHSRLQAVERARAKKLV
ncbi:MAG TPA: LuxR C-terminal-related transcriptional regulator [Ktedonobacterales bacterium]